MSTEVTQQTGMLSRVERTQGEVAIAAVSARAKAEVEARYVIALQRPRNIDQTRITILAACRRPKFAEGARYRKPVGGNNTVEGLSIRFAEEAIKAMTNIVTDAMVIWEDNDRRNIRITVTDLESNTTYSDDIIISKTVERKKLKDGQAAISERMNSYGEKVFLVAATEDDIANKVAAAKSKVIRNSGLRLIPQDILEEAEETIIETLRKGGEDPAAAKKKLCDAFASIGVQPAELERLLGHSLDTVSPKELIDLRATYSAIKDGETSWKEVIEQAAPKRPAQTGPGEVADPAQTAGAIDKAAKQAPIENPIEVLTKLIKDTPDVSEDQVLAYAKSIKFAKPDMVELMQIADSKLRELITRWQTIVPAIKEIQV